MTVLQLCYIYGALHHGNHHIKQFVFTLYSIYNRHLMRLVPAVYNFLWPPNYKPARIQMINKILHDHINHTHDKGTTSEVKESEMVMTMLHLVPMAEWV